MTPHVPFPRTPQNIKGKQETMLSSGWVKGRKKVVLGKTRSMHPVKIFPIFFFAFGSQNHRECVNRERREKRWKTIPLSPSPPLYKCTKAKSARVLKLFTRFFFKTRTCRCYAIKIIFT